MKIAKTFSYFNGLEHLLINKPGLWKEIKSAVHSMVENPGMTVARDDAPSIAPFEMTRRLADQLKKREWASPLQWQNDKMEESQTDFVKDRVAIEVQFGKYSFVAYDLFVKHLAFYVRDEIDVGVEILAMKSMQTQMSSGPAYYEGELYNIIRNGRGVPAVPLVILGVAP